jgi:hypothetical protein
MSSANVSPSAGVNTLFANLRQAVASIPEGFAAEARGLLDPLEEGVKGELNRVADTYLNRLPAFGPVADQIIKAAIDKALDEGLAQLTAAKSALAS